MVEIWVFISFSFSFFFSVSLRQEGQLVAMLEMTDKIVLLAAYRLKWQTKIKLSWGIDILRWVNH